MTVTAYGVPPACAVQLVAGGSSSIAATPLAGQVALPLEPCSMRRLSMTAVVLLSVRSCRNEVAVPTFEVTETTVRAKVDAAPAL